MYGLIKFSKYAYEMGTFTLISSGIGYQRYNLAIESKCVQKFLKTSVIGYL